MKALLLATVLALPSFVHAQSVHLETGAGWAWSKDMGDGTWYQQDVPHSEKLSTRAYLIGLSGDLYGRGAIDLRAHLDYVYFGSQRASCVCVPDTQYNPQTHKAAVSGYIPFNGSGHVQGVAATLDIGYTAYGLRFGLEGGPWVFWNTWHVSRVDPAYPGNNDLSHDTVAQLGWIAGASIESGRTSFSYRYYAMPQKWNPYPGLATGTHMLMLVHRF